MATCLLSATNDRTLENRIRDRLARCGHAAMRTVECSVDRGRINLTGRTRTYYLKQLAQEIARATPGAGEIANEICVAGPAAEGRRKDS